MLPAGVTEADETYAVGEVCACFRQTMASDGSGRGGEYPFPLGSR